MNKFSIVELGDHGIIFNDGGGRMIFEAAARTLRLCGGDGTNTVPVPGQADFRIIPGKFIESNI